MPVLSYRKSSSIGDISEVDIQNYSIFFFGNPASLELPYWKSTVLQEYFTGNPTRAFDIELGFQLLQIIPAVYPVHSALFEPNVQRPSIVFNWLSVSIVLFLTGYSSLQKIFTGDTVVLHPLDIDITTNSSIYGENIFFLVTVERDFKTAQPSTSKLGKFWF